MQAMAIGRHEFETTRWSIVLRAGKRDGREALLYLCQSYWHPVYAFIRMLGVSAEDAEDLTQGFLHDTLLEREDLAKLDRSRGRFRSWLRTCARYYVANWRNHEKRRPFSRTIEIDIDGAYAEDCLLRESGGQLSPDRVFDRRWALTVIERAKARLHEQHEGTSREPLVAQIERRYSEAEDHMPDAELAAVLGKSPGAVRVERHQILRGDLRQHLRAEVAETLADRKNVDAELQYLLEAVS